MRTVNQVDRWVWFSSAACACGLLAVLLALTVHDHGSSADPYCIRHCYTLVQVVGPGVLGVVGAPLAIGVAVFALLLLRHGRGRRYVVRAAWTLALLGCIVTLAGLFTSVWFVMLPAGVLTVCAVATAP